MTSMISRKPSSTVGASISPKTLRIANPARAEAVVEAGGDVLVAGAAVFAAPDPAGAIAALRTAGERGWQARSRR